MPLLKLKEEDQEKLDVRTMVKGTISVSLTKSNVDAIVRRGYTEVFSNEFKIMIYHEPIVSAFLEEKKTIDNLWSTELGKRKKKITKAQLQKLTKAFNKKYGIDENG